MLSRAVKGGQGVQEGAEHTSLWGTSVECECGGCVEDVWLPTLTTWALPVRKNTCASRSALVLIKHDEWVSKSPDSNWLLSWVIWCGRRKASQHHTYKKIHISVSGCQLVLCSLVLTFCSSAEASSISATSLPSTLLKFWDDVLNRFTCRTSHCCLCGVRGNRSRSSVSLWQTFVLD